MRNLALLMLLLTAMAARADEPDLAGRVGLAELRNGAWCLAIGSDDLAPGGRVLLYEPYQGLKARAQVLAPAPEGCEELKSRFLWPRRPDAPVHLYRLKPEQDAAAGIPGGAGALFALLNPPPETGAARLDLDGDGGPELFRICTSGEGLHFLVESGERVLWHAYYFLGFDVEPDCPDRIFAE